MYIQEPIEELVQCSGDNFGILSDFSDHNTDSSTPLVADHLEVGALNFYRINAFPLLCPLLANDNKELFLNFKSCKPLMSCSQNSLS